MKTEIEIEVKPFTVPNYVTVVDEQEHSRTDGPPSIPLSKLSVGTLDELCNQFRVAVFANAKKQQPATAVESYCPECSPRPAKKMEKR